MFRYFFSIGLLLSSYPTFAETTCEGMDFQKLENIFEASSRPLPSDFGNRDGDIRRGQCVNSQGELSFMGQYFEHQGDDSTLGLLHLVSTGQTSKEEICDAMTNPEVESKIWSLKKHYPSLHVDLQTGEKDLFYSFVQSGRRIRISYVKYENAILVRSLSGSTPKSYCYLVK